MARLRSRDTTPDAMNTGQRMKAQSYSPQKAVRRSERQRTHKSSSVENTPRRSTRQKQVSEPPDARKPQTSTRRGRGRPSKIQNNLPMVEEKPAEEERSEDEQPIHQDEHQSSIALSQRNASPSQTAQSAITSFTENQMKILRNNSDELLRRLPELEYSAACIMRELAPSEITKQDILDIKSWLSLAGTPKALTFRRHENFFRESYDLFSADGNYITIAYVVRALLHISDPSTLEGGAWRPDPILFKANVANMLNRIMVSEPHSETSYLNLQLLDENFPQFFMSDSFPPFDKEHPGVKDFHNHTFQVGLELRTQHFLHFLTTNLGSGTNEDNEQEFDPMRALQTIFFIPSEEYEDDIGSDLTSLPLKPWNLEFFNGRDGSLANENEEKVRERVLQLIDLSNHREDDENNSQGLEYWMYRFPWSDFLFEIARWTNRYVQEINAFISKSGGIDKMQNELKKKLKQNNFAALRNSNVQSQDVDFTADTLGPNGIKLIAERLNRLPGGRSSWLEPHKFRTIWGTAVQQGQASTEVDEQQPQIDRNSEEAEPRVDLHRQRHEQPEAVGRIEETIEEGSKTGNPDSPRQGKKGQLKRVSKKSLFDRQPDAQRVPWEVDQTSQQESSKTRAKPSAKDALQNDNVSQDEGYQANGAKTNPPRRRGRPAGQGRRMGNDDLVTQDNGFQKSSARSHPGSQEENEEQENEPPSNGLPNSRSPKKGKKRNRTLPEDEDEEDEESRPQKRNKGQGTGRTSDDGASNPNEDESHDRENPEQKRDQTRRASVVSAQPTAPPSSHYQEVNEEARMISMRQRGNNGAQTRKPWTETECNALIYYIEKYGTSWSLIKKKDEDRRFLEDREQVPLKDKARNMKVDYLLRGASLPKNFEAVALSKKEREKLRNNGIDVDNEI